MTRSLLGIVITALISAGQAGQPATPQKPAGSDEAAKLSSGWSLLASGDAAKASAVAQAMLSTNPLNVGAAALLIEAEVARGGAAAGFGAYEHWLAGRPLEDAYLLRRPARALLWESAKSLETGVEALKYLAADNDADARAELARRMVAGGFGETAALARNGDEGAVRRLIAMMEKQRGSKQAFIEALVQSRSPLAVPPLTTILDDTNHPNDQATAADGLGLLNGTSAMPKLRKLYVDQPTGAQFTLSLLAAGALFRMDDMTGLSLLQRQLTSDVAPIRLRAAEVMAGRPDPVWQQVVRGLIGYSDPVIRIKAARLLAPYDLPVARQVIDAGLLDQHPDVRGLAADVMMERTATDFATLRRLARSLDEPVRIRAAGRLLQLAR